MPHAELNSLLTFNDSDLQRNRSGQLSDGQRLRLHRRQGRTLRLGLGIAVVLASIATLTLLAARYSETGQGILQAIGIALTLINALVIGYQARYWMRLNADIQTGQVSIHSGTLERVLKPLNRRVILYVLRVEGVEVVVDKDVFKQFTHHAVYTLYRAPYSGILLAAETGSTNENDAPEDAPSASPSLNQPQ